MVEMAEPVGLVERAVMEVRVVREVVEVEVREVP
jgi:hypothetical protein